VFECKTMHMIATIPYCGENEEIIHEYTWSTYFFYM